MGIHNSSTKIFPLSLSITKILNLNQHFQRLNFIYNHDKLTTIKVGTIALYLEERF